MPLKSRESVTTEAKSRIRINCCDIPVLAACNPNVIARFLSPGRFRIPPHIRPLRLQGKVAAPLGDEGVPVPLAAPCVAFERFCDYLVMMKRPRRARIWVF